MAHPLARRRKEEAAETLTLLVRYAPRLARTYCHHVLEALLPLLRSESNYNVHASTASALLDTLAVMLDVATSRLDAYAEELLALLVQATHARPISARSRLALRLMPPRAPPDLRPISVRSPA